MSSSSAGLEDPSMTKTHAQLSMQDNRCLLARFGGFFASPKTLYIVHTKRGLPIRAGVEVWAPPRSVPVGTRERNRPTSPFRGALSEEATSPECQVALRDGFCAGTELPRHRHHDDRSRSHFGTAWFPTGVASRAF